MIMRQASTGPKSARHILFLRYRTGRVPSTLSGGNVISRLGIWLWLYEPVGGICEGAPLPVGCGCMLNGFPGREPIGGRNAEFGGTPADGIEGHCWLPG